MDFSVSSFRTHQSRYASRDREEFTRSSLGLLCTQDFEFSAYNTPQAKAKGFCVILGTPNTHLTASEQVPASGGQGQHTSDLSIATRQPFAQDFHARTVQGTR